MGCGCGRRLSKSREKKRVVANNKSKGHIIRKRRVSKLVAVPGRSSKRKSGDK